ncbi:MAG: amidohydrolase family protein [Firmicutes bacterium]|jgi:predicted TIM-barrel fold metal-dependent hydrolase|nr:amidohydrolase family protein [Bacillota bacterium]
MDSLWLEIHDQVKQIPVIDTHEHLPHHDRFDPADSDILFDYLLHYMSSDLRSAGLSVEELEQARSKHLPLDERWEIVAPYWEFCRCTGYGRALDLAVQGIYGVDGIRKETIVELGTLYKQRRAEGHMRFVLKDLCRIELSILDSWASHEPYDRELFRYAWQPTPFITASQDKLRRLEEQGVTVNSLDDWLQAFSAALEENLRRGVVALKNAMAYERTLYYEKVDYASAKSLFADTLTAWRTALERGSDPILLPKAVQDFLMHYLLKEADARGLVMQVHTGILEGSGNVLANGRPSLLNNLFLDYPNVKFDMFHISYPYCGEAGALGKMFPNVYLDMCWAHIISPAAAAAALSDFLDAVPYNKIMGFGGDYGFVDGVYGHLVLARETISRVLAEKVRLGVFGVDQAVRIAEHLLYKNPKVLFSL